VIFILNDGATFDGDALYSVATMPGVAFRIVDVHTEETYVWDDELEFEVPVTVSTGNLVMRMRGDDRDFVIDPDDITAVHDPDDVCSCGQIGCDHT
jgi:hypothetical protein